MTKIQLKINRINDDITISFKDFGKNWHLNDNFKEMKLKLGVPYLMDFQHHFTLLNEENIDLVSEIKNQLNLEAIYKNNTMFTIGKTTNKSNIVENIIMQGLNGLKDYEDEITLLNLLRNYLVKHHIDCYFKSIFQLAEDGTGEEPDSYSHWVLYLKDFKLYIDLEGIFEHDKYIEKIATKYNHDKNLVGYISTEPIWDDELEIAYQDEDFIEFLPKKHKNNEYEHIAKWFEFCNLRDLMLEDEEFKKHLSPCSIIIDLEECPF